MLQTFEKVFQKVDFIKLQSIWVLKMDNYNYPSDSLFASSI